VRVSREVSVDIEAGASLADEGPPLLIVFSVMPYGTV
jgi:hypothetical protein